jgi:hypothetical protein
LSKDYYDQYLLIDSKPTNHSIKMALEIEDNVEEMQKTVLEFSMNSRKKIKKWKDLLNRIKDEKMKAVVWGSGSKCVGFMTTLNVIDEIDYIIDINPLRNGKFIPGAGKQIKLPEFLRNYKPDIVIIMNPVYLEEIKDDLVKMELFPEIIPCS